MIFFLLNTFSSFLKRRYFCQFSIKQEEKSAYRWWRRLQIRIAQLISDIFSLASVRAAAWKKQNRKVIFLYKTFPLEINKRVFTMYKAMKCKNSLLHQYTWRDLNSEYLWSRNPFVIQSSFARKREKTKIVLELFWLFIYIKTWIHNRPLFKL